MLKNLLLLTLVIALFSSCKKDAEVSELTGTDNPDNIPENATYQPITKDSYWKNEADFGTSIETETVTMTGKTKTINNKIYNEAQSVFGKTATTSSAYYYNANHVYKIRSTSLVYGITVEFEYLNDTAKVGYSWTRNVTDDGTVNDVPARLIGKIKEVGLSKIVNGKTFKNVIHTEMQLQYNMTGAFETSATYDTFIAKGVGIIQMNADLDLYGLKMTSTTKLKEYSIK